MTIRPISTIGGHLTQVANGNSVTKYLAYNALGQVTHSQQMTSGETYSFSYVYNLAGALTSETYPSGRVVTTGYEGANRVNTITGSLGGQPTPYASGITYAPHGAASFLTYGNQVARNVTYTNRLQVNSYQDTFQNSTSNALFSVQETWGTTGTNNNGNLSSETIAIGGPVALASLPQTTRSYQYDTLNRLSVASDSSGWSRQFNYDPWGNMWVAANSGVTLAGNTPAANVFNGNNQMTGSSYDSAGNILLANGLTLTYDAENRQASATEQPNMNSAQELYLYDGNGQRVEKIAPAGNTIYVFDAFGQLSAEYNTFSISPACTTCYLSTDRLGSVRMVTDQTGTPVTQHDYLPFGEEITASPASNDVEQRFTGQIRDGTGLDYFNARYFTAPLGRFNSADPANAGADPADPQTWNGYSYVRGNPITYTDPSGLFLSATSIGAADGGPVGAVIGAVVDLFSALFDIFGGGGGHAAPPPPAPTPPVSSYPAGQTSGMPSGSWPGGENLGMPPGMQIPGPFGIGLPNPYVFSMCPAGDPNCGSPMGTGAAPAAVLFNVEMYLSFSKALQHNNPNPTKGVQPVRDNNGRVTGWTVPGKGAKKGRRIPKDLDWGRTNGLDPNDPKWAARAVMTGVGAVTLTEILEMAAGALIF